MALDSMKEIFERSARENIPFWEIVLQYDMEERQVSRQASMAKMLSTWQAIQDAADSYTGTQRSVSGLVGGDGLKMRLYARRGESIGGEFMDEVIVQAISMAESNACMRRIVAAPTAGSCGVVPAVLLPLCEREHYTQHELLEALYVASGIGAVIAYRASISGAAGGCQAEIGTASAMAAGALVSLRGGTNEQIGHAVAMALKNLMGLVCDPVAGLVEVPCVKRNVIGAVNAISAADMALAGIESRIPVDEVIDAMGEAGRVPRDGARWSCRYADWQGSQGAHAARRAVKVRNKVRKMTSVQGKPERKSFFINRTEIRVVPDLLMGIKL